MKLLILHANGAASCDEFTRGNELAQFQYHVGGYIQLLPIDDAEFTVFVNEDGRGLLPRNRIAESLFGWPDVLHGDVVVAGGVDTEGDTTGITEEQLRRLRIALCDHSVEVAGV